MRAVQWNDTIRLMNRTFVAAVLLVSISLTVASAESSATAESPAGNVRLFAHGSIGLGVVEDSTYKRSYDDPDWDYAWTEIELTSDGAVPVGMVGLDLDWRPGGPGGGVYLNAFADAGAARINRTADIEETRLSDGVDPGGVTGTQAEVTYDMLTLTYGVGVGSTFLLLTSDRGGVRYLEGETSRVFRFGLLFGGAYSRFNVESDSSVAEELLPGSVHRLFYGFKFNFLPPRPTSDIQVGFDLDVRILGFRAERSDKAAFPLRTAGLVSFGAVVRLM